MLHGKRGFSAIMLFVSSMTMIINKVAHGIPISYYFDFLLFSL